MAELCKYVDVCIANEEDAADVFGICASDTEVTGGKVNYEGYKEVAKKLADRFGFEKVAITLRTSVSARPMMSGSLTELAAETALVQGLSTAAWRR